MFQVCVFTVNGIVINLKFATSISIIGPLSLGPREVLYRAVNINATALLFDIPSRFHVSQALVPKLPELIRTKLQLEQQYTPTTDASLRTKITMTTTLFFQLVSC